MSNTDRIEMEAILESQAAIIAGMRIKCAALESALIKADEREANLKAEVDLLKADAERYRYIRDDSPLTKVHKTSLWRWPHDGAVFAIVFEHSSGTIPGTRGVCGEELDRLCDSAIQASREPR